MNIIQRFNIQQITIKRFFAYYRYGQKAHALVGIKQPPTICNPGMDNIIFILQR
jgi:hypothetical protein